MVLWWLGMMELARVQLCLCCGPSQAGRSGRAAVNLHIRAGWPLPFARPHFARLCREIPNLEQPRPPTRAHFYTAETRNCAFEGECIGTSKHHYSASWCRLCHISSGTFRHVSNVWNEAASLRQKVHHSSRPT